MHLSAVLTPAEVGRYAARNPETLTITQEDAIEATLANLAEAVGPYLEVASPRVRRDVLSSAIIVSNYAAPAAA